jgi:hypothetical protein
MLKDIKKDDVVKVCKSGSIGIVTSIQYEFDRYELQNLENWQYGIKDLKKLNVESLIQTIKYQSEEINKLKDVQFNLGSLFHNAISLIEGERRQHDWTSTETSANITCKYCGRDYWYRSFECFKEGDK